MGIAHKEKEYDPYGPVIRNSDRMIGKTHNVREDATRMSELLETYRTLSHRVADLLVHTHPQLSPSEARTRIAQLAMSGGNETEFQNLVLRYADDVPEDDLQFDRTQHVTLPATPTPHEELIHIPFQTPEVNLGTI